MKMKTAGADEPLCRPQRQAVDLAQRQRAGDGEVGVEPPATPPRWRATVAPAAGDTLLDPQRQASALDER